MPYDNTAEKYVMLVDILGFSKSCETESVHNLFETVKTVVNQCSYHEVFLGGFSILHYADTVLLYQTEPVEVRGYDLFTTAIRIFNALLAERIPSRITISRGQFESTSLHAKGNESIYVGKALIDAHNQMELEKMLCVVIAESAAQYLKKKDPAAIGLNFTMDRGNTLLVNNLWEIREIFNEQSTHNVNPPQLDAIRALRFVIGESESRAAHGASDAVAAKYHSTLAIWRSFLGYDRFSKAREVALSLTE